MDLRAAMTEFFYARDLTPSSRAWYHDHLGAFVRWCAEQGTTESKEVTTALTRRFLAELKDRPTIHKRARSPQTLHGAARAARAFLNFCIEEGYCEVGVFRKGMMPKRDDPCSVKVGPAGGRYS
jgi:site-specific recombinase XerD